MRLLDLQRSQHGLVHGAHRHHGRQVALGVFCRPASEQTALVGTAIVVPAHSPARQRLPLMLARPEVAGHGQYRFRRGLAKQAPHGLMDTAMNLLCGSACGQGKIEAIDPSGLEQAGKVPQRCLGLSRARFGFENYQLFVQRKVSDRCLSGARCVAPCQGCKIRPSFQNCSQPFRLEPDVLNRFLGPDLRVGPVIWIEIRDIEKDLLRRAQPVGEHDKAAEQMLEIGARG